MMADPQEEQPLNRLGADHTLRSRSSRTLTAVQASGIAAWRAFTRDEDDATLLDPGTQQQLRELGYID